MLKWRQSRTHIRCVHNSMHTLRSEDPLSVHTQTDRNRILCIMLVLRTITVQCSDADAMFKVQFTLSTFRDLSKTIPAIIYPKLMLNRIDQLCTMTGERANVRVTNRSFSRRSNGTWMVGNIAIIFANRTLSLKCTDKKQTAHVYNGNNIMLQDFLAHTENTTHTTDPQSFPNFF